MTIGESINRYNKSYSPYMKNLVNHLPMGQLALYQMTGNVERAEEYAQYFTQRFSIDPVNPETESANSLAACVGKRDRYEECLPLTRDMIRKAGMKTAVTELLSKYMTGMSSGLFHVLIRLAYAVEGAELEKELEEEVARALAYYVTAYREAGRLERRIDPADILDEMMELTKHPDIRQILADQPTLGKRLKELYASDVYHDQGFLLEGTESEKAAGLLSLLVPAFINSNNMVVLHGITGLHALLNLKDVFTDFNEALDVYTTCCLTHLLTVDDLVIEPLTATREDLPWETLLINGSQSRDVHTIKFTYTCHQLEMRHGYTNAGLRNAARFRIESR